MDELKENTISSYLGPEFQLKLMWQLLVEPEFAEKTIPNISVEYFDDPNLKRLFLIMLEFIKEFNKVPNLQNQTIHQAIYKYKTPNNVIEEESLFSVLKKIELWNERVLNKQQMHDGDVVQQSINTFIKQQEYRKLGEFILDKTKNGEIKQKYILSHIEEKIQKIGIIGDDDDYGSDVTEGIENALKKEFRQTIPTGIGVLDNLTGGGLGKSEIGLILSPSGVGKTTLLTKIANTARELNYNVLQIIFEDTKEQVQRKHFSIWSEVPLSMMDERSEYAIEKVNEKIKNLGAGCLVIKRFSQEDTTMKDIRNFITRYQKKHGIKFDIVVLDYLDCLESHKKVNDRHEAELQIIKSFEAMAGDLNIPCWSAIQSNRCLDLKTIVNIKGVGKTEIMNVKIGDEILTQKGFRKISNVFPITKQKTYKIKTKSGREIICSKKHIFPVNENELKSISSGLVVGDKLMVNGNSNEIENIVNITLIYDEIVSIEEYGEIDTIDITVEDTHMFFANDIYTHNSGFDSELVEAHQTGGNIKRVQKAHFFMSIAKTPEQKEAHLANIRIIKARFAQDGQTFKDCIFNNDTMQIIIRDDRYSGDRYKGMKKYGESDIEKLEAKTTLTDVHSKICEVKTEKNEEFLTEDLIKRYNEISGSKSTPNEKNNSNVEIELNTNESNNLKTENEILLIEENVDNVNEEPIKNVDISISNDEVNESIIVLQSEAPFEWTGETENCNVIQDEIKSIDISTLNDKIENDKSIDNNYSPPLIQVINKDVGGNISNFNDIENMFSDPDEPNFEHKQLLEFLNKTAKSQKIIKKE